MPIALYHKFVLLVGKSISYVCRLRLDVPLYCLVFFWWSYECSNNLFCHTDVELRFRQHPNHTAHNIPENGIVRLATLGTLLCTTPYQNCCQNRGHWQYPNGSVVPTSQDGTLLFTSRTDKGRVSLQKRTSFTHESANGVYECQIPNENGRTQTLYVGIYSGPLCK